MTEGSQNNDERLPDAELAEMNSGLKLPALPSRPITYDHVKDPAVQRLLYDQEASLHAVLGDNVGLLDRRVVDNLAAVRNSTQKNAKIDDLLKVSTVDQLTDLRNRRAFVEAFPVAIERAQRGVPSLAFLIFDLDNFKEVNDRYGHDAGDAVLKQFAGLLKELCRKTEQPFRWGGEEFVVIADAKDLEVAMKFAERVREAVENYPFRLADGTILKKTASVGVTSMKEFNGEVTKDTAGILMEKADSALYKAKNTGRNRCLAALRDGTFKTVDEIIK